MSMITLFSGSYCNEQDVLRELVDRAGCRLIRDEDVVSSASSLSGLAANKIHKALSGKSSAFNTFTHEKERSITYLRLAMAEMLSSDGLLVAGFSGHLIPRKISHVLRICLVADLKSRTAAAALHVGMPAKEAANLVRKQDEEAALWVSTVAGSSDPWGAALYDILIPTDKVPVKEATDLIVRNLSRDVLQIAPQSQQAVQNFLLAARVEVALAKEGHHVEVDAENGAVTLTINKHVRSLSTKIGKGFHQADIYRKVDFELPSKVLLVDDEREFVQTLSERLLMRDMGSAVAYDGESALSMIREDEPEVMILDLKMPGIDGIEVLRRVKQTRPEIEVIILTGHGSEEDRATCLKLGAFAYLQKPVDIDRLTETLKQANEKMRQNIAAMKNS
jgi:two-component system response regulator CpxR